MSRQPPISSFSQISIHFRFILRRLKLSDNRLFHHHPSKKLSRLATRRDLRFPWIWVPILFLFFLNGCPSSSKWDQQWQEVQHTLKAGRLQEAKEQLHQILPSVRDNDPTDARYGQVIFQLADIARLEGNTKQAESYYWKALPLIAGSLGPEHLHMADPLSELATIYEQKNQPTVALPLIKRALAIQEKTWGTSSRHLLPTLKHYHLLLMLNDYHNEALQALTRISHLEQMPP